MRRFGRLVALVTLIVFSCAALAFASSVQDERIWVVAPARVRVIPEAEVWRIPLAVLALQQLPAEPVLDSVSCLGKDLFGAVEDRALKIPVVVCRGMAASVVDRWVELRRICEEGELTEDQAVELERLTGLISRQADRGVPPAEIRISTDRLPFAVQDQQDYPVVVRLQAGGQVVELVTIMATRTLPPDPEWSPGDFHLHTNYSDGNKSPEKIVGGLRDEGYKIAYITDHTNGIASHGWSVYASAVIASSIPNEISLYPGAEMTVGDWDPDTGLWVIQGDLLAHGVNSLTGLENMEWSAQQGIDNIWANSSYSSAAIAHPSGSPPWTEWTVTNYRGLELMSGSLQGAFHDGATPMVKWRRELTRLLENTFTYGYFASARTGSDWHQGPFDPSHPQYVTWVRTPNWSSRSEVDIALLLGRTVASQKGGLAYMTISYGSTTKRVGDILTGVPAGATLVLRITFKPVESGTYTIKVYRNDKVQEVFSKTDYYGGGQTYDLTWPNGHSFTFPGGSNYYYLYVAGSDFIYSSPIFIKGN